MRGYTEAAEDWWRDQQDAEEERRRERDESQTNESETVTVCDKCLQASCWQGIFMCQSSQNAGTVEKTITELEALGLEHPHYWQKGAK